MQGASTESLDQHALWSSTITASIGQDKARMHVTVTPVVQKPWQLRNVAFHLPAPD